MRGSAYRRIEARGHGSESRARGEPQNRDHDRIGCYRRTDIRRPREHRSDDREAAHADAAQSITCGNSHDSHRRKLKRCQSGRLLGRIVIALGENTDRERNVAESSPGHTGTGKYGNDRPPRPRLACMLQDAYAKAVH